MTGKAEEITWQQVNDAVLNGTIALEVVESAA